MSPITYRERQFQAHRMLLCAGDEPHACEVPKVNHDYGSTGAVECSACGSPMQLIDVITVDREPRWGSMECRGETYTDAKLTAFGPLPGLVQVAS